MIGNKLVCGNVKKMNRPLASEPSPIQFGDRGRSQTTIPTAKPKKQLMPADKSDEIRQLPESPTIARLFSI